MSEPRWKPNVTVAAIVERDGRYLVVEEGTPDGLRLNNPAGHLDPGETPLQAVVREALEETARVFEPSHLVGVYLSRVRRAREDITYLRFAFAGSIGEALAGRRLDDGIVRCLWLDIDELRASADRHRSPLLLACVLDHAAGRRFPLDVVQAHASLLVPPAPGASAA